MKLQPRKRPNQPVRQTVEGNPRTPVYSYHSMRNVRNSETRSASSEDIEFSRTSPFAQLLIRRLTLAALVIVLLFGLWLRPEPQVTLLSVEGTVKREESTYKNGINKLWAKRLLNQTKLTIQTEQLSSDIEQTFPEIETAVVELPLLGKVPNVVITPGQPALTLVTQKGAFYVNTKGKTMSRTDEVTLYSPLELPSVRDDSNIVPEPGKQALSRHAIQTVIHIVQLAKSANLQLESIVLPLTLNEVDIVVKGSPYVVKISLDQDPRQGIGALIALREKFQKDDIQPTSYVDIRVPDKAFYK